MLRISHYVTLAAGAAALFAQAELARAHAGRGHRGYVHGRYHAAFHTRARFAEVSPPQIARGFSDPRDYYAAETLAASPQIASGFSPLGYEGYLDHHAAQTSAAVGPGFSSGPDGRSQLQGLVEQQASANGVPASLVHRVIMRESGYNPRACSARADERTGYSKASMMRTSRTAPSPSARRAS